MNQCSGRLLMLRYVKYFTLFLHPVPVYWDLTLPILEIHALHIDHDTPKGEVVFGANERYAS